MTDILSYEGFKDRIVSQLKSEMTDEFNPDSISVTSIVKNNDTVMECLQLYPKSINGCPCIYFDDLYESYRLSGSIEEIIAGIVNIHHAFQSLNIPRADELNEIIDNFDKACSHIEFRLINADRNVLRLKDNPHYKFGEFALSYYLKISDNEQGFYCTQITNGMMEMWGVDTETLHKAALDNMSIDSTFDFISIEEITGVESDEDFDMYILTNKSKMNGATVIISGEVRRKVADYVGGDYYILPSSVHEVIIVPKPGCPDVSSMISIIREINRSPYVKNEEILSDNLYEYSVKKDKVTMIESTSLMN